LIFLSVACGVTASWISGELRISLGYLVIDTAQVGIVGVVMWVLTRVKPFMSPVTAKEFHVHARLSRDFV
jgi:hypothetical protein